ncbi:MAG: winged helix-turn-helix domain-containing protein [Candidatus Bathyarchaeota archaeon]
MTTKNIRQWLAQTTENTTGLFDILTKADAFCVSCTPASPMHCIERCEIWKTKNEFIKTNPMFCRDDHIHDLLNAVKNSRRKSIMEALYELPRGTKGLQEFLKSKGYRHSQRTIVSQYVEPLMKTGLVESDGIRYRLTLYGKKFHDILDRFNAENLLPPHSRCYEEIILKKLKESPKTYKDLAESLTQKSLSRSLRRLIENGLVSKSKTPEYIFYFRTKKVPKKAFSPTEKRVYNSILDVGVSARKLSWRVGISIRRIYKYLRRLRKRRLVFTRKKPRTYSLTPDGNRLADFLEEIAKLVIDASKASCYLLKRSGAPVLIPPVPLDRESSLLEVNPPK